MSRAAKIIQICTLSLISSIRDRLNPEFLFSDLMALMAPDFISLFACSVAVAVSTTGWSDKAERKMFKTCIFIFFFNRNHFIEEIHVFFSGSNTYFVLGRSGWFGWLNSAASLRQPAPFSERAIKINHLDFKSLNKFSGL